MALKIPPKDVVDAYRATKARLKRGGYFELKSPGDDGSPQCSACALTVLALNNGVTIDELAHSVGCHINIIRDNVARKYLAEFLGDPRPCEPTSSDRVLCMSMIYRDANARADKFLDGFVNGFDSHDCNIEHHTLDERCNRNQAVADAYLTGYATGAACWYAVRYALGYTKDGDKIEDKYGVQG